MRKTKAYLITGLCLAVFACSKKEISAVQNENLPREQTPASAFFHVPDNTPALIKRIATAAEKQDQKDLFSAQLSKSLGKPAWDKFEVMINQSAQASRGGASDTTVLIPFVKEGKNVVSSLLACLVTKDTVVFNVYRGNAYKFYPYTLGTDKLSANQMALQMMALQRKVFGDSTFTILDDELFPFIKKHDRNGKRTIIISPSKNAASKIEQVVNVTCYDITFDGDEGQLVGAAPGEMNNYGYTIEHICVASSVYVWSPDDYSGGGNGGGSSSSGGSGGGTGGNPCGPTENHRAMRIADPGDCGGGMGWEPSPYALLSAYDCNIINQLAAELKEVDDNRESPCHSTARFGNVNFNGTLEHWIIQLDYLETTVGGNVEYYIPGAGASGVHGGYADLVNILTKEIFEIKRDNEAGLTSGKAEVANYVAKATANCQNGVYTPGTKYTTKILPYPKDPTKSLKVRYGAPGVLLYDYVDRATNPVPIAMPSSILQKLKDLVRQIILSPQNMEPITVLYLKINPEIVSYIKGAAYSVAISIIAGTIIEDIITLGGGITDDWASFLIAYKIVKMAKAL